ncbi:uncharacterized protein LOC119083706 [Bradysia coprophila]|uniref:uncharacterized protein LOC119083706 n=1 Tax=Bradysia coprophila TaxID=38358 RepID=UPI00187D8A91|nr:uncharacterized protein LOC119083706 [Bradysia coprophila]
MNEQERKEFVNKLAGSRHFRFGTQNPTLMEEPFWKYMICNPQLTGYNARKDSQHQLDFHKPVWCFARFGATQTYLPDGRLVCIGGEHEDSYDPDFQIYNDVVVIERPRVVKGHSFCAPPIPSNFPVAKNYQNDKFNEEMLGTSNDKHVTIYGYPLNVFPPTDFHTATYVLMDGKEYIYIIGGTGCSCEGFHKPESCSTDYHLNNTRVFRLCVSDFSIERVETTGNIPRGCTYTHSATLSLTVFGRPVIDIEVSPEVIMRCSSPGWENHNRIYRLEIETGVWTIFKQ